MKKIISCILLLCLFFSLGGCSLQQTNSVVTDEKVCLYEYSLDEWNMNIHPNADLIFIYDSRSNYPYNYGQHICKFYTGTLYVYEDELVLIYDITSTDDEIKHYERHLDRKYYSYTVYNRQNYTIK